MRYKGKICGLFFVYLILLLPFSALAQGSPPSLIWKKNSSLYLKKTPALGDDGIFYALASPRREGEGETGVTAINPEDGSVIWGPVIPSRCNALGHNTLSVGANGIVYAIGDWLRCNDGLLIALNSDNGEILWQIETASHGYSPHPRNVPALNETLNSVYFGSTYLYSVNMDSGQINWMVRSGLHVGSRGLMIDSTDNLHHGTKSSYDSHFLSFDSNGIKRWERYFSNSIKSMRAVAEGDILLLRDSAPYHLLAWDKNGNDLWQAAELDGFVTDEEGNIYAHSITTAEVVSLTPNGYERWRTPIPNATWVLVDFVDNTGHLYARAHDKLYAISTSDGSISWSFTADAPLWDPSINIVSSSTVLTPCGQIFFSDIDATLYLLGTSTDYAASSWPIRDGGNRRHTMRVNDILPLPVCDNESPIAVVGPNQTFRVGDSVTLDGSGSNDPDGNYPLSYHWEFVSKPEDSAAVLSNPYDVNPGFIADLPGNFSVRLVVTDSLGKQSEPSVPVESILQPGPVDGVDMWITSVYSGGGKNDHELLVGGWGDYYYALIQFNIDELPPIAQSAKIHLFNYRGNNVTDMYLDRVDSHWDENTKWPSRPSYGNLGTLPSPIFEEWYIIDITSLYNDWKEETFENHGIQLRPTRTDHKWNIFCSSDYVDDLSLRPKVVVDSLDHPITMITVAPNNPPALDPIGNKLGQEGVLLQFQLSATDPDSDDILVFSADNLPLGASLDSNSGLFSWVPTYDQAGNYEVEFTVTDNGIPLGLDVEIITISIGNVNRPPEFSVVDPQNVDEGQLLEFTVTATDPDIEDQVAVAVSDLPDGASFEPNTGVFSWTPYFLQEGNYTVIFTATDNGTPVESTEMGVVITVGNVPNPTNLNDDLVDDIEDNPDLPNEIENSYLANLKKVTKFINQGKITPTLNQLYAFICKVEEDIGLGVIDEATGNEYIFWAEQIILDLGGDPASRNCT